jgi:aspartyl-tRNA synthetase
MSENLYGMKRTHMCGELGKANIGETVTIMGWTQRQRNLGSLIFIQLRDRTGIVQAAFNSADMNPVAQDNFKKAETVRSEFVLAITGKVVARTTENINPDMMTGEIEIETSEMRILSTAETPPIYIEENLDANEAVRLKYRYLDLRRPDMQKILMTRHKIAKVTREYFDSEGFLEIETPVLTKSTPEGARDYLVPSRVHKGKFFALPQSPQIFKQLLMVAGYDRYMQIIKCYRDEDLRADRQPEFTQVDFEMSFVDVEDILSINEGYMKKLFKDILGIDIKIPIDRITYAESMKRFGVDRPDTRFGMELINVSDVVAGCGFKVFSDAISNGGSVRAINAKGGADKLSRKKIDALGEYVKTYGAKGLAWIVIEADGNIKSPISKFFEENEMKILLEATDAKPGDVIFFVADKNRIVFDALGHLRLKVAEQLEIIDSKKFSFIWVTEFPMFEFDEEEKRHSSVHHPFTAPMDEDVDILETDPLKVRAKAYDMVLNGSELGGGSIRIHSSEVQSKIFKLLGFTEESARERFGFLLDALKYGTPPHGGTAFGLDRIVMLMCGTDNIKDVIAFPKVQTSACLMTDAPSIVDEKQLDELGIKVLEDR